MGGRWPSRYCGSSWALSASSWSGSAARPEPPLGLNHPNIILVYDVGQDGLSNYIVMEYVEGNDLRELVRQAGAISPEQVIDLGCQIAAALEYAHRKGLIHRDVKSQNVLLTSGRQGQGGGLRDRGGAG